MDEIKREIGFFFREEGFFRFDFESTRNEEKSERFSFRGYFEIV